MGVRIFKPFEEHNSITFAIHWFQVLKFCILSYWENPIWNAKMSNLENISEYFFSEMFPRGQNKFENI